MSAICLVKVNGSYVRSVSGKITLVDSEPSSFDVTLANHDGAYGPASWLAQVAAPQPLILTVQIVERVVGGGLQYWNSPDFIVEEYSSGGGALVQLSGRCRLAELDDDDRVVDAGDSSATVEDGSLPAVAQTIVSEAGLSVAGLPPRTVREYHLTGNLLSMFSDLVYPLEHFQMGVGTQIVCKSAPTGTHSYTDQDHLLDVRFRRSRYRKNRAVVERLESGGGIVDLAAGEREDGSILGVGGLIALSEPSRRFWIDWRCRRGGMAWAGFDGAGNFVWPAGGGGLGAKLIFGRGRAVYSGITPITHIRPSYLTEPGNNPFGDAWTPWYQFSCQGYSAGAEPVVEGYSATGDAGTGPRRRFPQPFSLPSIGNQGDAQAAANAIAAEGNREGASLAIQLRLTADVPPPFSTVNVSDGRIPWSGSGVVKTTEITWDERSGGQNGISVQAGVSE